jgi:tetratricopeptide (TPR) repeat protein
VGADELPLGDQDELLGDDLRRAAAEGKLEIISETQFWQRLGLVESDQNVRRLYTPAMLADLLDVPLSTIRRWHRRGLIVPARVVHRLPYFDFQEVATARRLAQLLAAGASPAAVEKKLEELARYVPDVERPLAQLSVIVEGKQLLLRQGEGLIEPGGQLRIDFDAVEVSESRSRDSSTAADEPTVRYEGRAARPDQLDAREAMLQQAALLEDDGELGLAADMHRAVMAAGGPRAEVCFQLAELLYRMGDTSGARERYYTAIELDEDYVEARANLGCVLAETGQPELALAAFEGALRYHPEYLDVHYHLARTLDDLGRSEEAEQHWREFLNLAPDSPWADEARARLEEISQ